ncbi:MAG: response regulator [Elusimicrobia bacterium]|nr:response regulator [Candidatus Liberimonas magnetica]
MPDDFSTKPSKVYLKPSLEWSSMLIDNLREGYANCKMLYNGHNEPVDWTYLDVNKAFEEIIGIKKITGKKTTEIMPYLKESNPEIFEVFGRVALTGKSEQFKTEIYLLNKWLDITTLSSSKGYFLAIFQNITEQRHSEEEKNKLHEQLLQSQKMDAIGRLVGGIAHDFNNQLTAILGFCNIALGDLGPDNPASQDLIEITKAGEKSASLIRQLMAFARKQVLIPKILNLNELITDIKKMLSQLISENIKIELNLENSLGSIKVDPAQIEQVLLNLIVNARDAMPKGGLLIIETKNVELDEEYAIIHPEVHPGPYVKLEVADTGHGMTQEVLSHIFEPFYTTKEYGKGTGLGLSTVHGIVKQSGGHISVYSEIGKGTSFRIYFPQIFDKAHVLHEKESIKNYTGNETILLVEDEDGVKTVIKRILESNGYKVIEASSSEDALKICRLGDKKIHLLITDVIMSGMDGSELSTQIKKEYPDIKVLFMSGYIEEYIVHRGVLDEGINFMQKPIMQKDLLIKVREVLEKK